MKGIGQDYAKFSPHHIDLFNLFQELDLRLFCVKGIGQDHAKFSQHHIDLFNFISGIRS